MCSLYLGLCGLFAFAVATDIQVFWLNEVLNLLFIDLLKMIKIIKSHFIQITETKDLTKQKKCC